MPDGMTIPLNGEVYIKGSNRTALSVLLFLFVVFLFVVGGVLYLIRNNDSERKFFDPRWKHYHKGND